MKRLLIALLALALCAAPRAMAEAAPTPVPVGELTGVTFEEIIASLGLFDPDDIDGVLGCEDEYLDHRQMHLRLHMDHRLENSERRPDESWLTTHGLVCMAVLGYSDTADTVFIDVLGDSGTYGEQNGLIRMYNKHDDDLYHLVSALPVSLTCHGETRIDYTDVLESTLAVSNIWHGYNGGLAGISTAVYDFTPGKVTLELYAEANVAMPSMFVRKSMPAEALPRMQEFAQACYAGIDGDVMEEYGLTADDYRVFTPEIEYPWREDGTVDERCFSAIDALSEAVKYDDVGFTHTVRPATDADRGVHGEYYDLSVNSTDPLFRCRYEGDILDLVLVGRDKDFHYDGVGH